MFSVHTTPEEFQNGPIMSGLFRYVWTIGLTVEIKLRFSDGLVWTVRLTAGITLRFQILPAWCGRSLRVRFFKKIQD